MPTLYYLCKKDSLNDATSINCRRNSEVHNQCCIKKLLYLELSASVWMWQIKIYTGIHALAESVMWGAQDTHLLIGFSWWKESLLNSMNLFCPATHFPGSCSEQWNDWGRALWGKALGKTSPNIVGVFDLPSASAHCPLLLWCPTWHGSRKLSYNINTCCSSRQGTFCPVSPGLEDCSPWSCSPTSCVSAWPCLCHGLSK